jgi:hypothetical protein
MPVICEVQDMVVDSKSVDTCMVEVHGHPQRSNSTCLISNLWSHCSACLGHQCIHCSSRCMTVTAKLGSTQLQDTQPQILTKAV